MRHKAPKFKLGRALRRLGVSERGAATVEFVFVFPFFVVLFLSSYDVALMNMRAVMMERAMDMVVREIRLSSGATLSYDAVLSDLCRLSFLIRDCQQSMKIELRPVDTTTWTGFVDTADCIKREETIQPAASFQNGQPNELMLIRVCAVVDPAFAGVGVGRSMPKDDSGGYQIIAASAFVNEPT